MESVANLLAFVEVDETCPKHKCKLATIAGRDVKPVCPKCELEKLLAEKKSFDQKITAELSKRWLRRDSLVDDEDTFKCSFDNFKHEAGTQEDRVYQLCHKIAGQYYQYPEAKFNTLLVGTAGTGKSHLAMSMLKAVNDHSKGQKCLFVNIAELFQKIRNSFNDPSEYWTEGRAVSKITNADLVVLDDLGTEASMRASGDEASQFVQRVLYSILNSQKRIIVTSNLTVEQFQKVYNQKLFSRLTRGAKGHVVDFTQLKDKRSEWQNLMK
ncbi:ATP-binding protein [Lactobacillus mulieris]|uniref:ATP-binding protein n=1 Tax=Lactobacillus mulieris TaxID=2508708 RepID=UPI001F16D319|nr:ATP-binding protein [Lactobacillus mulieris]MCF1797255.1 ATP-binding protein [Lactobacillus mulieris]